MEFFSQLKAFRKNIRRYLHDYGGARAVFLSPFFVASVFLSLLSYNSFQSNAWVANAIAILPSLLGFSLGTYALLFSLMSGRTKLALRTIKNYRNIPYLDELNATFFHFILVQIVTVLWAYLYGLTVLVDLSVGLEANGMHIDRAVVPLRLLGSAFGITLFIYSLLLVIASSLTVFRIARIVDPNPN